MKRRDFLKTGLKVGVAANALPMLLGGSTVRALGRSPLRSALQTMDVTSNNNVLVIIQLAGGNDGLNTLVPVAGPQLSYYQQLRQNLGLSGSNVTSSLPDHQTLGFQAGMEKLLALYGSGQSGNNYGNVAILQNVGYPKPILSHFRGTDIWNTGTDSGIYASSGWVGRFLAEQNPGWPPATPTGWPLAIEFGNALSNMFLASNGGMGVAMNSMPSQAAPGGMSYDPIPQNPTTQYNELAFVRLVQEEANIYTQTILNRAVSSNSSPNPYTNLTNNQLATQLSYVAQLIASKGQTKVNGTTTQYAPPKIYLVTQSGYDTHSTQLTAHAKLVKDLSDAIAAFQTDIEALGVADNVAIMTYSEFGRRPKENGSGTDHGTAAPLFIIGTQIKGTVYGDDSALDPNSLAGNSDAVGNLTYHPQHDFRNVYATVMNEWLLAGKDQAAIDTAIQSVLTQDANGIYSTNSTWQSLGIFKAQQQSVQSSGTPGIMLLQNYPNPASGVTTIDYVVDATGPVELGIFRSDGTEIARVVDERQSAGPQSVQFNTSKLTSGAYLYRLKTANDEVTQRMVVVH